MNNTKQPRRFDHLVNHIVSNHDGELYPMGEPGYSEDFVIIADWNKKELDKLDSVCERHGYLPGFHDEWFEIDGKAYRSTADSYDWRPSWVYYNDEYVLKDEIRRDFDTAKYYIENNLIDNPDNADTIGLDAYLIQLGFTLDDSQEYEAGIREGCNDDPKAIMKTFNDSNRDIVFAIKNKSDPYVTAFKVWYRDSDYADKEQPDRTPVNVCFVYPSRHPDNLTCVFLNKWKNAILLESYDYPCGTHHGFSPGVFDDITNNVPIYGTGGEEHWMAASETYTGSFLSAVARLHRIGYEVSIKPVPEKSYYRKGA